MAQITIIGTFTFDDAQLAQLGVVTTQPSPTAPNQLTEANLPNPLMTTAWPLNQVATAYPIETRKLNSSYSDNVYSPKNITDVFYGDFGTNHIQINPTMPVNIINSANATPNPFVSVNITTNWGSDDASHVPCLGGKIEGEGNPGSDSHLLVLDVATNLLHELFGTTIDGTGKYSAQAYRQWDVTKPQIGTPGQNSADAAGLPIVPLLLRYSEAATGVISHALRATINLSRANGNGGVFTTPACHASGQNWSSTAYMGQRLYLNASYDTSGFTGVPLAIVNCFKTFGIVIADNGISGLIVADDDPSWAKEDLSGISKITLNDFTIVNSGAIIDSSGAEAI